MAAGVRGLGIQPSPVATFREVKKRIVPNAENSHKKHEEAQKSGMYTFGYVRWFLQGFWCLFCGHFGTGVFNLSTFAGDPLTVGREPCISDAKSVTLERAAAIPDGQIQDPDPSMPPPPALQNSRPC